MSRGRTVAIIQARMGSTRLPGKVLKTLDDRCVLRWVLDRLARASKIDQMIVATSTSAGDDLLAEACSQWSVDCFRGSENDVLGRFVAAAHNCSAEIVLRVNADNPLVDPIFADELIEAAQSSKSDYLSYRRGDGRPVMLTALSFFTEAVTCECLDRAATEIDSMSEREHVTLGIYRRPERYRVDWLDVPEICNDPRLRFTLDTADDFDLLTDIFAELGDVESASVEQIINVVNSRKIWLDRMAETNDVNPKANQEKKGEKAS